MLIGIVGWIVAGLLIGFVASKLLNLHGDDPMLGIAAAGVGAVTGALVYTLVSGAGVTPFNGRSLVSAAVGACAAMLVWHGVRSRFVSRAPHTRRSSYS